MGLTDSGGVQEEATCLGKPTLVMRDTTERPEAAAAGTMKLVGNDYDAIVNETTLLLTDPEVHQRMSTPFSAYGDGNSAQLIVEACIEWAKRIGRLN